MTNYNTNEEAEAKRIGATPHKNSGRGTVKGDASLPGITIDFKFTNTSFNIDKKVWAKVCADALKNGHSPALNVIMGEDAKTRLWVVDAGLFHEMYEAWQEKYEV